MGELNWPEAFALAVFYLGLLFPFLLLLVRRP